MDNVPVLSEDAFLDALRRARRPFHTRYRAMYSSVLGGILTDPTLMVVPADDHMVHRGDAVFETLRIVDGAFYNLQAHLARLERSAERIGLVPPVSRSSCEALCRRTASVANLTDATVRILVSRGPGSLGVNPYDCPQPQLYIVIAEFKGPFMDLHPAGASVIAAARPARPGSLTVIKSCNYLLNALIKREAVDRGADFALAFDEKGFLTEGATENAGIIDASGRLRVPPRNTVLDGTTMIRIMQLIETDGAPAPLTGARRCPIHREDVESARELLIFGTTTDVTAVTRFDDHPVGDGNPGPAWSALHGALRRDMKKNETLRTAVSGVSGAS